MSGKSTLSPIPRALAALRDGFSPFQVIDIATWSRHIRGCAIERARRGILSLFNRFPVKLFVNFQLFLTLEFDRGSLPVHG